MCAAEPNALQVTIEAILVGFPLCLQVLLFKATLVSLTTEALFRF